MIKMDEKMEQMQKWVKIDKNVKNEKITLKTIKMMFKMIKSHLKMLKQC